MNCKKTSITNIGDKLVNFSYRDCSDSKWKYQVPLFQGQTKSPYIIEGTLYVSPFFESDVIIDGVIFPPTPSNTRTPTPTPTPTVDIQITPTITSTPSGSPSITPTNTPTNIAYTATTCDTTIESYIWTGSGGIGYFIVEVTGVTATGDINLEYSAYTVPDRFSVVWGEDEVINTGFVGSSQYDDELIELGYPATVGAGNGSISFNKPDEEPSTITIYVEAPITNTAWAAKLTCPQ
jgi:hypothetical protein